MRLLKLVQGPDPPKLVIASIQSLIQPVPERSSLNQQTRSLRVGDALDMQSLVRWLVENEFHGSPAVELPGEFSTRGGLLDIFAPDWNAPVRLEFFGDQIESIRRFEISTNEAWPSSTPSANRPGAVGQTSRPLGRLPARRKLVPLGRRIYGKKGNTISSGWSVPGCSPGGGRVRTTASLPSITASAWRCS